MNDAVVVRPRRRRASTSSRVGYTSWVGGNTNHYEDGTTEYSEFVIRPVDEEEFIVHVGDILVYDKCDYWLVRMAVKNGNINRVSVRLFADVAKMSKKKLDPSIIDQLEKNAKRGILSLCPTDIVETIQRAPGLLRFHQLPSPYNIVDGIVCQVVEYTPITKSGTLTDYASESRIKKYTKILAVDYSSRERYEQSLLDMCFAKTPENRLFLHERTGSPLKIVDTVPINDATVDTKVASDSKDDEPRAKSRRTKSKKAEDAPKKKKRHHDSKKKKHSSKKEARTKAADDEAAEKVENNVVSPSDATACIISGVLDEISVAASQCAHNNEVIVKSAAHLYKALKILRREGGKRVSNGDDETVAPCKKKSKRS